MWTKGHKCEFYSVCQITGMSETWRNLNEVGFLPLQGGIGVYYSEDIKGEQGTLGFPGVQVGDLPQTAPCCLTNMCMFTYNYCFPFQGLPGFPGIDGPTGPQVRL